MLLTSPALALEVAAVPVEVTNREPVRIDGSGNMAAINQLLKQRYEQQFPGAEVKLNTSSTETAIEELLNDEIDLAAIGRPLTAAEKAQGLKEVPISREKIAIIVGQENPFKGDLTVEQLSQIFGGEITDWSEVGGEPGPIRVIDRPILSDTRLALRRYPMFRDPDFAKGEQVIRLDTDDTAAVIRALGRDGISYAIASQLAEQDQARIVKLVLRLDVLPDDPLYPYTQPRGYAYKQTPTSAAQAFLGFATAKSGQAAVASAKITEAKAVAEGEPVALPVAQPVTPDLDRPAILPTEDRTWFWWLWLPLILVGLLIGWLTTRFRPPITKEQAPPEPTPVPEPPNGTTSPVVATAEVEEEIEEEEPPVSQPMPLTALEPVAEEEPSDDRERSVPLPDAESIDSGTIDSVSAEPAEADTEITAEVVEVVEMSDVIEAELVEAAEAELVEAELIEAELVRAELVEAESAEASIAASVAEAPIAEEPIETAEAAAETPFVWEEGSPAFAEPELPEAELSPDVVSEADRATAAGRLQTPEPSEPSEPSETAAALVSAELVQPRTVWRIPADFLDQRAVGTEPPDLTAPLDSAGLQQAFLHYLYRQNLETATLLEQYTTLATLLRDRMLALSLPGTKLGQETRLVGEIAAEFMPGPHLANSLLNLGLMSQAQQAMQDLGLDLKQIIDQEEEPGLGKGGLGRLMVCYLESLATLNIPAIGYGIRYEYGIFDQEIQDGWQVEVTDTWLRHGNPWEVERPDRFVTVHFGGSSSAYVDDQGRYRVRWLPAETVRGVAYDTPIPGYQTSTASLMRLWKADASDLCKVLYPVDIDLQGKALRLKQQYFLVACALQDAMRLHLEAGGQPETIHQRWALQLNDTDPTIGIAELMRLLVDDYQIDWEQAWEITQRTFGYTNHSLMPETLDDQWSVGVFGYFLPRHLEIIYEINYRLLETVKALFRQEPARLSRMSLIDERGERYIRLNYLATVGSHAVNGVSQLHTELLKQTVFRDFYQLYPDKFSSKTNGVSPRRFLLQTNPELANLITSKLGQGWIRNLDQLRELEAYATNPGFRREWLRIKQVAKHELATRIRHQTGLEVNPNSLFDVQAMVIHEYKRQHLNLLHILTLYNRIKANPQVEIAPRAFIFAGKAVPDYSTAKLIIRLIHAVADLVNSDAAVRDRLKVVFLKDFNIKTAQPIYPAIDLSEHISLAGTEAADTGNMIAALNAALIIGTPDGTNLELRDAVGTDNFFQFGLTAAEVQQRRSQYNPMTLYQANAELRGAIDLLSSKQLTQGNTELFQPLINLLLYSDRYLLLADYPSYVACQERVSRTYRDPEEWTRMSILTTARMGRFSSDQAVRDYAAAIWKVTPTIGDSPNDFPNPAVNSSANPAANPELEPEAATESMPTKK
ncbi:MAG: glycogen/starch/alpha-glucan family phosphorylase [Leptolyngbya sp. IPPAS B-1204]